MTLRIKLRGPLRIQSADSTDVSGLSRRGQAMLAFLADRPDMRAERGYVADLLWSDRSEEQARASLRQELSVMRKVLPEGVLDADRQHVWLARPRIETDRSGSGELLEGFDLRSEAFEDWLRMARNRSDDPASPAPGLLRTDRRDHPVLAVLPFDDLGTTDGEVFADGVVEEITGALSRVRDFEVIARQSAFALKGRTKDHRAAAEALGANYLVEGSVRRAGDRVRIAVQLISGEDGVTLWSERFDDRLDDLFDLQDRIAAQVAGQLSPRLRAVEIDRALRCNRETSSAYEVMLTALPHFWAHRREENLKALALLDEALARDPDFVPAMAYKAWALAQQPSYMWSDDPIRDHRDALALANRAAGRAGDHAPTWVALSAVYAISSNDPELAASFAERALAIDPNNAWGWMRLGWAELYYNTSVGTLGHFDKAMSLSPLDPFLFNIHIGKSSVYRQLGDFDAAIAELDAGFRANPGITWAIRTYVGIYALAGRDEEALAAARTFVSHYPDVTLSYFRKAVPRTIEGRLDGYVGGIEEMFRRAGLPEA